MGLEIRTILDANGSLLETEGIGHMSNGTLTPGFIDKARTIAKNKTLSREEMLGDIVDAHVTMSKSERLVEQLSPAIHRWHVLGDAYYGQPSMKRNIVWYMEKMLYGGVINTMFNGYSYAEENDGALRRLQQAGIKNSVCTGIDHIVKEHLLEIMRRGLPYLDPQFGIVMRPKYSSGIYTKTGLAIISEEAFGEEVHAFEDELRIAFGIVENTQKAHVWLPISYQQGFAQRQDWSPPPLSSSFWNRIHLDTKLPQMAERIAA